MKICHKSTGDLIATMTSIPLKSEAAAFAICGLLFALCGFRQIPPHGVHTLALLWVTITTWESGRRREWRAYARLLEASYHTGIIAKEE